MYSPSVLGSGLDSFVNFKLITMLHEKDRTYKLFQTLLSEGCLIYPLKGKRRLPKESDFLLDSFEEIQKHLETSPNHAVGVIPRGRFVALDFDTKEPVTPILEGLKSDLLEGQFCIIEETNRGYHLWFFLDKSELPARVNETGFCLRGLPVEAFGFKRNKRCLSLNPSRIQTFTDGGDNLPCLDLLPFLSKHLAKRLDEFKGENGWVIEEGSRNSFLAKMGGIVKNKDLVFEANKVCCSPSLSMEEIERLAEWSETLKIETVEETEGFQLTLCDPALDSLLGFQASLESETARVLQEKGFPFIFKADGWYLYNGTNWEWVSRASVEGFLASSCKGFAAAINYELRRLKLTRNSGYAGLENLPEKAARSFLASCKQVTHFLTKAANWTLIREHLEVCQDFSINPQEGSFVCFQDVLLDLDNCKVRSHSSLLFTTHVVPCKLSDVNQVSAEVRGWLQFLTERDPFNLVLLLLLFRYAICPGDVIPLFLLHGCPGSSKTTLAKAASILAGGKTTSYTGKSLRSLYSNARLHQARLILFQDINGSAMRANLEFVKQLTGGDTIPTEEKFEKVLEYTPKYPVIVTTNDSGLFNSDPAMVRRTASIYCPRIEVFDPTFTNRLQEMVPSLAYLGLCAFFLYGETISNFGEFNRDLQLVSPLSHFCQTTLAAGGEGVALSVLRDLYGGPEKLREDGVAVRDFGSSVRNVLSSEYGVETRSLPTRRGQLITNVHLRKDGEKCLSLMIPYCEHALVMTKEAQACLVSQDLLSVSSGRDLRFEKSLLARFESGLPIAETKETPASDSWDSREGVDVPYQTRELFDEADLARYKAEKTSHPVAKYNPKGSKIVSEKFAEESASEFSLPSYLSSASHNLDQKVDLVVREVNSERSAFWNAHQALLNKWEPYSSWNESYGLCKEKASLHRAFTRSLGKAGNFLHKSLDKEFRILFATSYLQAKKQIEMAGTLTEKKKLSPGSYYGTRRSLSWSVFPSAYTTTNRDLYFPNGYSRIDPLLGTAFPAWEKTHQSAFAAGFSEKSPTFELVDIDLSSAHLYIASHLMGADSKTRTFVLEGTVWARILEQLNLPFVSKPVIKAIVYRSLNGGDLRTIEKVPQVQDLTLSEEQLTSFKTKLAATEFYVELNGFLQTLRDVPIYTPECLKPLPERMPAYIRVSRVLTGLEVLFLMALDFVLSEMEEITPIAYAHDGLTAIKRKNYDIPIDQINTRMSEVMKGFLTVDLKVEEKKFKTVTSSPIDLKSPEVEGLLARSWKVHPDILRIGRRAKAASRLKSYREYLEGKVFTQKKKR